MRDFKLPLIVTGAALALALVFGLVAITWIHQSKISSREKELRAQRLGSGVAVATCVVVAPFWLITAAKVGKQRRLKQAASRKIR
jgi:hypothetical protein